MSNSSAQVDYLTISSDNIVTLDNSSVYTIDLSSLNMTSSTYSSSHTITLSNTGTGYSSLGSVQGIGPITTSDLDFSFNDEFKGRFPDWNRIQKMCDEYPGLKIAFEKFKTTYMLVKDDYDAPPNKKIRP